MAITFAMISFDEPIKTDNESILSHLGFVEEISGKTDLNFTPQMWDLAFDFDYPVYGTLFKLLEDKYDLPYLTIAFENVIPMDRQTDQLFSRRRTVQLGFALNWMIQRMDLQVTRDGVTHQGNETDSVVKIQTDMERLYKNLADARRNSFTLTK